MTLVRTAGLLLLSAASTLACAGCRGRGAGPSSASATAAPPNAEASRGSVAATTQPALGAADLAAYRRGCEKELELMRAALVRLRRADGDSGSRLAAVRSATEADVERAGAAAAGVPADRYRDLVVRVDSLLLARGRGESRGIAVAPSLESASADEWRLLDSLRVELAVLRSRFGAAAEAGGGAP